MKNKGGLIILFLLASVVVYASTKKKKRRGSIEIGPLDKGEFVPDNKSRFFSDINEKDIYDAFGRGTYQRRNI